MSSTQASYVPKTENIVTMNPAFVIQVGYIHNIDQDSGSYYAVSICKYQWISHNFDVMDVFFFLTH